MSEKEWFSHSLGKQHCLNVLANSFHLLWAFLNTSAVKQNESFVFYLGKNKPFGVSVELKKENVKIYR